MPVYFLKQTQAEGYGQFLDTLSEAQLMRYCHLDDFDIAQINQCRGQHNRLGFAVQLVTVRFIGMFLPNPIAVPEAVIHILAVQLCLSNADCLPDYLQRKQTWHAHRQTICKIYGYRDFGKGIWGFSFIRWLYMRAWYGNDRPSLLFDLSVAWLTERKILLPGITTLTRLIANTRERAAMRLWNKVTNLISAEQVTLLESLLHVEPDKRISTMDDLRKGPVKVSAPELFNALHRYDTLHAIGIGKTNISSLPLPRILRMGQHALSVWAQVISRMPDTKRRAMLFAFVYQLETMALDEALDLLDALITEITAQAVNLGKKERLRTLKDLDQAALLLREACLMLFDPTIDTEKLREQIFDNVSAEVLQEAVQTVGELARPADDNYHKELTERYGRVRRFLPTLLHHVTFHANQSGEPVLQALDYLAGVNRPSRHHWNDAPMDIVSKAWKRLICKKGENFNYQAYTLCIMERLQDSLRRRDIFVEASSRWNDPRTKLLSGKDWLAKRAHVCRMLGLPPHAKEALASLGYDLDAAYKRTAKRLPDNPMAQITQNDKGRNVFTLSSLDKQEEPESLITLRHLIRTRLPQVSLPEILLEVHLHTGFADLFTHISENTARAMDLPVSICAVLLAEACNIGIEPLLSHDNPALTRSRLGWVMQNYMRAETLSKANACFVDFQANSAFAAHWGNGEVASADGLRMTVPVDSIHAKPNKHYFPRKKGITWYNFLSDLFAGFHGIVIPGTMRDSIYILEGLLEQQSSLQPTQIMTDTAGASDIIFGLFTLLGYQFSPRLADMGNYRLWRMDKEADYGELNDLAYNVINHGLIESHWEDMLRTAGSLQLGTIKASEFVSTLMKTDRPSGLARAVAELGRISKTIHILNCVDDETYRRNILIQLNRTEARHSVARAICHGQRGEIRKRYRNGQESQLGALGLVLNAIVIWNTLYIEEIVKQLKVEGHTIQPEDLARISPLEYSHINTLGKYFFILSETVAAGQLRPLRNQEDFYANAA
jgi:TnpA family transposase